MRDDVADPRRHRTLAAFDGQEGLGQRDGDLVGVEGDDRAVAADDLQGGGSDFATGGQAQDTGLQGDSPYRGAENRRCGQPEIDAPNHRRGSQPVVESARRTNGNKDTRNLSSGTPRPKTMKESSLRQVSWLSVQRASPAFPDDPVTCVGEALADYSC